MKVACQMGHYKIQVQLANTGEREIKTRLKTGRDEISPLPVFTW